MRPEDYASDCQWRMVQARDSVVVSIRLYHEADNTRALAIALDGVIEACGYYQQAKRAHERAVWYQEHPNEICDDGK